MDSAAGKIAKRRNLVLFVVVFAIWLSLDRLTKGLIMGADIPIGSTFAGPYAGIFQLTLVHNTGAAWGIFANSTFVLGIVSLVLPAVLAIAVFVAFPKANAGMIIALALVCAGGIGNGIDRLTWGYVVDMIEFSFMSFPVFNIADIGVTCGIPIFIIAMLADKRLADA